MHTSTRRWILAFDASCGTCRQISTLVERACGQRLQVLPLTDSTVQQWRGQVFGPNPEWVPVLFEVEDDRVRGWTGRGMAVRLVRRLGPLATARVVHALGHLRRRAAGKRTELPGAPTGALAVNRAQFLRFGAGALVVAGLTLTGNVPAFAEQEEVSADDWVKAHRGNLPQVYDEVVAYPLQYRKAIAEALPPTIQSRLWSEHLTRFRAQHSELTADQLRVLDRAVTLAGAQSTFDAAHPDHANARQRLDQLNPDITATFDSSTAYAAFATLGPVSQPAVPGIVQANIPNCPCSWQSPWCGQQRCDAWLGMPRCTETQRGCGSFWSYACNGWCR